MTEPRKVLGRGLSSLISSAPAQAPRPAWPATTAGVVGNSTEGLGKPLQVSVSEIHVNPRQPRRKFLESALEELAQSIREVGVLQPLIVRKTDRGYELIAGERRLRASRKAGLATVPVLVRTSTDLDQLEVALIENLQRQDLNPIEEALGYQRLAEEYFLNQEQIAKKVGKERSTISNLLRLLNLTPPVQEMLATGLLSMGHARALLPLESDRKQEDVARKIGQEGLSVRQVEALVRSMLKPSAGKAQKTNESQNKNPNLAYVSNELQRSLGTRVEVVSRGKGGEIRILYYSNEDLTRLTERLMK